MTFESLQVGRANERAVQGCELRRYQLNAIGKIEDALARGVRRIMLMLPTGGGKTLIASSMTARRRRVLFVVPRLELVGQTYEKFQEAGIYDVGIIQAYHPLTDSTRPIQICSQQTLARRQIPPADLVFIDEAHTLFNFYSDWFTRPEWKDVPFIGLSATPWTKGLGRLYQEMIVAATTQDLIDQGHLSPFRVFAPCHPDLSGVHTIAGDYHEGELGHAMDKQPLVADIVETWLKHARGRPTLCFAVNRAHAEHIRTKFDEAGVRAGYIDCFTKEDERKQIREHFASGDLEVVCNVDVLTMGVDWDVRCIILARPTKSEMRFVQAVGRGLRPAEGKDYCLILDHSDSTSRLGFVTDIHHDVLDNGRTRQSSKRDNVRLPKECPRCACLRPPHSNVCSNCGFEATVTSSIFTIDGELRELNRKKQPIIDKADIYGQLKGLAIERGYKPGFVYHKFKEYFGEEPGGLNHVPPRTPSQTIRNWVKSKHIAYVKARSGTNATVTPHLTLSNLAIPIGGFRQPSNSDDVPW
jgi:DNA repair protein RadD